MAVRYDECACGESKRVHAESCVSCYRSRGRSRSFCACGNAKSPRAGRCIECFRAANAPQHGTRACYNTGCRRPECREANTEYLRLWRSGRGREAVGEVREFRIQLPAGWGL